MGSEAPAKIYKINIRRKTAHYVILIFIGINIVMFTCGFLLGKGNSIKSENLDNSKKMRSADSIIYNPVDPNSIIKSVNDENKKVEEIKEQSGNVDDLKKIEVEKHNRNIEEVNLAKQEKNDLKNSKKISEKKKSEKKIKNENESVRAGKGIEYYTLEIYVYDNKLSADSFKDILAKRGYQAFVDIENAGGKSFYKVRLGKFKKRRDAVSEGNKLVAKGTIPKFYVKKIK